MSLWEDFHFEERIREILEAATRQPHHMGRPFLTPYQIAIEFAERHPDDFRRLEQDGLVIGGEGAGTPQSLPQYIARELSDRLHKGSLAGIEGGFISSWHMQELTFVYRGDAVPVQVRSSLTDAGQDLSLFRLSS